MSLTFVTKTSISDAAGSLYQPPICIYSMGVRKTYKKGYEVKKQLNSTQEVRLKHGVRKLDLKFLRTLSPEPESSFIKLKQRVSTISSSNSASTLKTDIHRLVLFGKSSYLNEWRRSADKRNCLSWHLNPWWISPSLKVNFPEILILFQR